MPTAPVQPYLTDRPVRRQLPFDLWIPVTVLVALLAVALLAPSLRSGPYRSVTFSNSSDYAFNVAVANAPGGSTTLLGTAAAKGRTNVAEVFDEGSSWTFVFSTQDRVVGQVVMSRDDLNRNAWQVDIPPRFAATLAGAGVVPTD